MAQAALGAAGLHFDELNKLRVLEPEVAAQTAQLREECRAFVDKTAEFQKIVGSLIELVDQLAKAAESEKMKFGGSLRGLTPAQPSGDSITLPDCWHG
ncbi:PREDICTED: intraflagellar transport protein 20 homolog isoform X2 [Pseudopodoces humilis]|uniref:intraflagellar transport protein 20 homolog isoform X2 n=1 Tax=Pseudopodoces humilis TaxID=181119 RepID=UPI0006B86BDA|nr:PREDICTED: intraflagellar transport protein 20 homolog isoform X2 [Pseudopodoces humilis]XP_014118576.1 PREDICTED: intraflagellar transport protein 20 homolog isoform X2 [Pseudopodoces humilis]